MMGNTTLRPIDFDEPFSGFVIYLSARIFIVFLASLVFLTSIIALSGLWVYLKTVNSPGTYYIRSIVVSSLLGVLIGQSMSVVTYATDFQLYSYEVCKRIRVVTLGIHFWSCMTNLVILTAMTIERHHNTEAPIPTTSARGSTRRKFILFISISLGTVIAITIVRILHKMVDVKYSRSECTLAFRQKMMKCKGLFSECSGFPIVIIITFTILGCSLTLYVLTKKLKQKVTNSDKRISAVSTKTRITNTRRIQATHYLWLVSILEWLPYGKARLTIYGNFSMNIFFTISGISHTISTLYFLSVPIIYYKMDRKFYEYVHKMHFIKFLVSSFSEEKQ